MGSASSRRWSRMPSASDSPIRGGAGTFEGPPWRRGSDSDPQARHRLDESQRAASPEAPQESYRHACTVCDTPVAWDADLAVHWIGMGGGLLLEARGAGG